MLYLEGGQGNVVSIKSKQKKKSGLLYLEWGQGNIVSIKSKQKRCSDTRTLMGTLIYIQEVLGIDHSKVLFNKGNMKMMYYNLEEIKLAMFDLDIGMNLFYKDNEGMTAMSQNGRVMFYQMVPDDMEPVDMEQKELFYIVHTRKKMFHSEIVVFLYYQDTSGMTANVVVKMETMDLEGNKELFYMGNMEVVDEVYYWNGMVYNLARKGKEIHYEVSEVKEDYRISKVIYNIVILMFMFYEENQVEKENVKMLYKGPVEVKVEMLEDDVVMEIV